MNLNNKTVFHYFQNDNIITAKYKGGAILEGYILGKLTNVSKIELLYHCITKKGELKAGQSFGNISKDSNGKLKLKMDWNWLNGDLSGGISEYIEIE